MNIPRSLLQAAQGVPEPASPAAYFAGWNRVYLAPVDDVLLFCRKQARSLQRRSVESHLHRRFVVVTCLEGAGTVVVDGVPFALLPGQAHLVFPQSYHSFSVLEKNEIVWMMITFETKEPERLAILRQRTLQLEKPDLDALENIAETFNLGPDTKRCDALSALVTEMLARWALQTRSKESGTPDSPARKYAGLWQRMQIQLEQLPPEDLRVGPLAVKLSISERHLRQKFQEQFGVSMGAYLRNYRIRRAIGLLASTSLSLAEISDRCGYRSASSFHRAFIKHTGMRPAEFRS